MTHFIDVSKTAIRRENVVYFTAFIYYCYLLFIYYLLIRFRLDQMSI